MHTSALTRALHSATTKTNNCLCAFGGDAPALAPFNVQNVSLQYLPTSVITPCSAPTTDLCTSDNAVCLCVCVRACAGGKIKTSHPSSHMARVIACSNWLGGAQRRQRSIALLVDFTDCMCRNGWLAALFYLHFLRVFTGRK